MAITIGTLVFSLICWAVFYLSFVMDRSRYRNCYLLFIALTSVIPFIINITGSYSKEIMLTLLYLIMAGLLITPFFLIHNGIVMIKNEGRRLPQLLSLALGIVILIGELSALANAIAGTMTYDTEEYRAFLRSGPFIAGSLFSITVGYVSMSFLIFLIYTLFMQIIPWHGDFDYVIVLGSGLIERNKVPKLLQDRLDKAIEVYRKAPGRPKLITSGGQGDDEALPEAEAMKNYLIASGIPEEDIITEPASTTTLENLRNSKEIIDNREGGKKTAVVSSNYHVYRALRLCKKLGFSCTGIGGHVAFYFWPSALIREYIAIHAEIKHAVIFVLGWVTCIILTILISVGVIDLF